MLREKLGQSAIRDTQNTHFTKMLSLESGPKHLETRVTLKPLVTSPVVCAILIREGTPQTHCREPRDAAGMCSLQHC